MDNLKRKRATKAQANQRVNQVLDLMVKRRMSDIKIRNMLIQSEGICSKTADRYIIRARRILACIGSQASSEERGLIWERVDELFAAEQNEKTPDKRLLNEIIRTQINVHKTHPNLKGEFANESTPAPVTDLSAELQKAVERLDLLEPGEGSEGLSPDP